jgi:hypothetical protein
MILMRVRDDHKINPERWGLLKQFLQLGGERVMIPLTLVTARMAAINQDGRITELAQNSVAVRVGSYIEQVDCRMKLRRISHPFF